MYRIYSKWFGCLCIKHLHTIPFIIIVLLFLCYMHNLGKNYSFSHCIFIILFNSAYNSICSFSFFPLSNFVGSQNNCRSALYFYYELCGFDPHSWKCYIWKSWCNHSDYKLTALTWWPWWNRAMLIEILGISVFG